MPAHRSAKIDEPREFAGYDLMHCLGRGGMGEVWSVVRRGLYDIPQTLAIKAMLPDLSDDEKYCEIFVTEGRIAMQLSSANIVPVFELGRHDGLLFMVMQRIDGVNLAELQRRTRNVYNTLPLDVVLYIVGEILGALFVAHEHTAVGKPAGVIHRDVKPANVLVSSSGDVRLTDFGIARPVNPNSFRVMPIGTLRYISREQAERRADRRSDLFSVGAIFHELLSGRQFREGAQTDEQLYGAIFNYKEIPPVGRVIPEDVERLRRGLLHPDPERRFQSAAEAMECLSECIGYRYARLKLARIYETSIGMRSSGFTESHAEAKPSFLLNRKSRLAGRYAAKRRSFVYSRRGEGREASFEIDEDASTSLLSRLPHAMEDASDEGEAIDEPTSLYLPVMARERRDQVGPHPIAPEPVPATELGPGFGPAQADGELEKARAITPTLQLLLPVGQPREPVPPHATRSLDPTQAAAPSSAARPVAVPTVIPKPEATAQRSPRSVPAGADPSDPRNMASTSGTIEAPDGLPELDRAAKPASGPQPKPASGPPSRLYFVLLVALLCALVGVSTAWFLESRGVPEAEAKP